MLDQIQLSGSTSATETAKNLQSDCTRKETRDLQLGSRPEETAVLDSGFTLDSKTLQRESALKEQSGSTLEETRVQSGARPVLKLGSRKHVQSESRFNVKPDSCPEKRKLLLISRSDETRDLQSGYRSNLKSGSRSEVSGCLKYKVFH